MPEDITQDPEYIRGYEKAKQRIEEDKGPYSQGWQAAYEEEREKERQERREGPTDTVTISVEHPHMKELVSIMERLLEHNRQAFEQNKQALDEIKELDERLKKLEKYTQE